MNWIRGQYVISTEPDRLDRDLITRFLGGSYWARSIPREIVDRSIQHSLCFGLYDGANQVGFARVITDFATFAYVADVFVLETHRGQGLALWLMQTIRAHPELQGLRRWLLFTLDAQELYRKVGFAETATPGRCMEIVDRQIYARAAGTAP